MEINLLCPNLDVMHIEKNVFENIFNTIIDLKGKSKDNIKARMDISLFCHCKNMELVFDESRVIKPKASFALEKNAQLLVYQWLKSLCFPDGHASNISKVVNLEECRLHGMKSHDCLVYMKTLIPLTYRDLLPKGIVLQRAFCVKGSTCNEFEIDYFVLRDSVTTDGNTKGLYPSMYSRGDENCSHPMSVGDVN